MAAFDVRMKELFDEVDHYIEDIYGDKYNLHPMRPKRGTTANPEADGLFNIAAVFTPGYRSDLGRGYLIDMVMSTLEAVDPDIRQEIYSVAAVKVRELLPVFFPDRPLEVHRDRNHYKILGDFSLGNTIDSIK